MLRLDPEFSAQVFPWFVRNTLNRTSSWRVLSLVICTGLGILFGYIYGLSSGAAMYASLPGPRLLESRSTAAKAATDSNPPPMLTQSIARVGKHHGQPAPAITESF